MILYMVGQIVQTNSLVLSDVDQQGRIRLTRPVSLTNILEESIESGFAFPPQAGPARECLGSRAAGSGTHPFSLGFQQ